MIIGAMKAGTTTIFRDLDANPEVFIPYVKETGCLRYDRHLEGSGLEDYLVYFRPAKQGQVIGEASTQYTKLPDFPGVPQRARQLLGPDIRIIYLVRNPVDRIVSQHYHHMKSGQATADINREVRDNPRYLNWSRYAMQIEAWLDIFDPSQVMIIRFEDYTTDRKKWVAEVSEFISVNPRPDLINESAVWNRGEGKVIPVGSFWRTVRTSALYQKVVHPFVPPAVRERLRELVLPAAPPRLGPPNPETVSFIIDDLADEMDRLRRIMGWNQPIWDLEATRAKYESKAMAAAP